MSFEPDLKWYSNISAGKGIPTHCPFASVHRCPRFYQSLSLMGHAGSTAVDPAKDEQLKARWEHSDLWPITAEQATALMGTPEKQSFVRFCPEVMFERFGLFVKTLHPHSDEFDQECILELKGPYRAGWEYNWSSLTELHYSDCNMYSLLESSQRLNDALSTEEILEVRPGAFGINLNLKALLTQFCVWWLKKVRKTASGQQPAEPYR